MSELLANSSGMRENIGCWPAELHSANDRGVAQSGCGCPFFGGHCSSVMGEPDCSASIPHLLGTGCPTTVSRFIAFIIVDSLKRVLRCRLRSHVRQECIKALAPSLANRDATILIIRLGRSIASLASRNHRGPATKLRSSKLTIAPAFLPIAAARNRSHRHEAGLEDFLFSPTVAAANPIAPPGAAAKDNEFTETLARQINFKPFRSQLVRAFTRARCLFAKLQSPKISLVNLAAHWTRFVDCLTHGIMVANTT